MVIISDDSNPPPKKKEPHIEAPFSFLLLGLRCGRFVFRLQGIQSLDLVLNLVDAVAPRLMLSVQFNRIIRIRFACFLVLGVLLRFVVVAVKLRLKC